MPMPELPEVETIARGLQDEIVGRSLSEAQVFWAKTAIPNPSYFKKHLVGQKILAVQRRAKYLDIVLEDGWHLIIHLRMSGRLLVQAQTQDPDSHIRAAFSLGDGRSLRFKDTRKFGRVWLSQQPQNIFKGLGPEPLDPQFGAQQFANLFKGRKGNIKALLLNQKIIAGVGNIYADESCFGAGIRPDSKMQGLKPTQLERLYHSLVHVLNLGINYKGASFDSVYVGGEFQNFFNVYGRAGEPCRQCKTPIQKTITAGRGTHFCPKCQKKYG